MWCLNPLSLVSFNLAQFLTFFFFVFHDLDLFEEFSPVILWNSPQFELVWCFHVIRLGYASVTLLQSDIVSFSDYHISEAHSVCQPRIGDVNFDHWSQCLVFLRYCYPPLQIIRYLWEDSMRLYSNILFFITLSLLFIYF